MSRRGLFAGAALGLLLLAASLGTSPLRAQSEDPFTPPADCSDPPPAPFKDGIEVVFSKPTGSDARTDPAVEIDAAVSNTRTRPVVGGRIGTVDSIQVTVVACEPQQVVPDALPKQTPRTPDARFTDTVTFPTNGHFAIVLEALGSSSDGNKQSARVVHSVTLAVPPKRPANVEVADPVNGVVTVAWDYADPEPDLFGFEIRRARQGSGDYVTIKNGAVGPRARSVSDSPPVGAWRYHVIAYRRGAPEGAVSGDDTVEIAEAAPTPATSGGGAGTSGGTGTGTAADGSTTSVGGSAGPAGAPRSSADLSDFAASLNARRTAPPTRIEPDPGFQETLPFNVPGRLEVEDQEEPEELGADEPNVGLGQRPVSDPGERQRSFGFVAFGLLLFVLSMAGLFLKSEVKRADLLDLDAVDPGAPDVDTDVAAVTEVVAPVAAVAAVVAATPSRRRRRRAATPDPTSIDREPIAVAAAATVAKPDALPSRRRRAPRAVTAPAVASAHRSVAAAIDIPETRNRWSGRVAEPANGHSFGAVHDFDDLAAPAGAAALATTSRRRARRTEAPLDAPGLDVPDPPPPTRRRTRPPTAPLPTRTPRTRAARRG